VTETPETVCEVCGHRHTGRQWAYICIGCSCQETPGAGLEDEEAKP
jgi:DNA-directed RNA polymerase subunit RPC12/RpoP